MEGNNKTGFVFCFVFSFQQAHFREQKVEWILQANMEQHTYWENKNK